MYPLKGEVGGIKSPFPKEFHSLGVREFVCKAGAPRPRREKRWRSESHHGPRKETQRASVDLEPLENIWGVEEANHGNPRQKKAGEKKAYFRNADWIFPHTKNLKSKYIDLHRHAIYTAF